MNQDDDCPLSIVGPYLPVDVLEFSDQLQPTTLWLSKPKKRFSMLPTCRTTRMGLESPGCRLFAGDFKRQPDGSEAGWGTTAVSADNCVRILCGPVTCDPGHLAILGASCSNNTTELSGFAVTLRRTDSFIRCVERVRILYDSKHAARVALGVLHARKNNALAHICNDLFASQKAGSKLLFTMSLATQAMLGTNAKIVRPLLGLRGLVSQDNLPSFWPDRRLLIHSLLSVPHCFSCVSEVLHNLVVELRFDGVVQRRFFFF